MTAGLIVTILLCAPVIGWAFAQAFMAPPPLDEFRRQRRALDRARRPRSLP